MNEFSFEYGKPGQKPAESEVFPFDQIPNAFIPLPVRVLYQISITFNLLLSRD